MAFVSVLASGGCGDDRDNGRNSEILGNEPAFSSREISHVPNEDAIGTKIWVPGLDEGYIPQGLTFARGQILISVYKSISPGVTQGPSKVFCVDPGTGKITGQFDLPAGIGHAGGLAYAGQNILYVADSIGIGSMASGKILKINLGKALEDGNCDQSILGEISLEGLMTPCFLTFDGRYLWFGTYSSDGSESPKIYKIDPKKVFNESPSVCPVSPDMTLFSFEVDSWVQGAAFDHEGYLWLSQSTSRWGCIQRLNPSNGEILDEYELMAGIEDLAVSPDGELWSVSEAGTVKYLSWGTYFPVIFQIDVTGLRELENMASLQHIVLEVGSLNILLRQKS